MPYLMYFSCRAPSFSPFDAHAHSLLPPQLRPSFLRPRAPRSRSLSSSSSFQAVFLFARPFLLAAHHAFSFSVQRSFLDPPTPASCASVHMLTCSLPRSSGTHLQEESRGYRHGVGLLAGWGSHRIGAREDPRTTPAPREPPFDFGKRESPHPHVPRSCNSAGDYRTPALFFEVSINSGPAPLFSSLSSSQRRRRALFFVQAQLSSSQTLFCRFCFHFIALALAFAFLGFAWSRRTEG